MSKSLRKLTALAVLIAIQIILSRFCSINAWNLKIGLGFLPVAFAGALFGPLCGVLVGAASDFLGAILFPIGPYFPGFTLSLALTGVAFGLALHQKPSVPRLLCAIAFDQIILSLLVNSFWISLLYGSPYSALLLTRSVQCLIHIPVEFLTLGALLRTEPALRKLV